MNPYATPTREQERREAEDERDMAELFAVADTIMAAIEYTKRAQYRLGNTEWSRSLDGVMDALSDALSDVPNVDIWRKERKR